MTEHPTVPLELPKGRSRQKNEPGKNWLVLNLKSDEVELCDQRAYARSRRHVLEPWLIWQN